MTQQDVAAFVSDLRAAMEELQVNLLTLRQLMPILLETYNVVVMRPRFICLTRLYATARHCRCRP